MLYHDVYERGRDREWVVLVHGAGGSVRTWKYQLEVLLKEFNVLQMDLRDHGNSQDMPMRKASEYTFQLMAQDVIDLMALRGIGKAHFIGVSMGTIIIRWIERLAPEKVRSIVFAGGVFRLNLKLKWGLKLGLPITRMLSFRMLSRLLSFLVMPRGNHQKARGIFLREADRIHPQAYKKWLNIVGSIGKELEDFYKNPMTVPSLVVMGAQDHVFLPPAVRYAKEYANVRLKVIPKCGHVCNIEAADQFNHWMISFLREQKALEGPFPIQQKQTAKQSASFMVGKWG